jgi:glycogen(starch) synthase
MFLLVDYTLRLAMRRWPEWAWFPTARARGRWLAVERRAYRCATRLFAMSAAVRSSLVDDYGIDPRNVIVVGSAPSIIGRPDLRRSPTGSLLMNVSDFRRKGGDVAIAALGAIRRSHRGVRLTLVGGRRPVVAEGVDDLGVVGPDRMRALFAAADLVLAPARCDPFPTFLLEAQHAGVPVVASARDGMPEIVDDGVTGTLLPDPTPAALSAAVVELLGDPGRCVAMSEAAARRAARRFSWSKIAPVIRGEIMREQRPRVGEVVSSNTVLLPQISGPHGSSPAIACNAGQAGAEWSRVG